jgi:hypothetical protein
MVRIKDGFAWGKKRAEACGAQEKGPIAAQTVKCAEISVQV